MSKIEINKDTLIGCSKLKAFTRKVALSKPNTAKEAPYEKGNINYSEQLELIYKIYNSFVYVNDGGSFHFKYIGTTNTFQIERKLDMFKHVLGAVFSNVWIDGEYETINIEKLFKELKLKSPLMYMEIESYFIEEDYYHKTSSQITLYKKKEIKNLVNTSTIKDDVKKDIIGKYLTHWRNYLPKILSWLTAYKYATSKKSARLVILAESNFGKSKLFEWLESFEEATFMNLDDFKKGGIHDKEPSLYEDKTALVLDEMMTFPRSLYDLGGFFYVRPQKMKAIKANINALVLLGRDGGTFNNDYMEKQTANRITLIDFRKLQTEDLGVVMEGYSQAIVSAVLTEYLFNELKRRRDDYEALPTKIDRELKAEEYINKVFSQNDNIKKDLTNRKEFFDTVKENLEYILSNPQQALSNRVHNEIWKDSAIYTADGWFVKRPAKVIRSILIDFDNTLKDELQHKSVNQILDFMDVKNKTHRYEGRPIQAVFFSHRVEEGEEGEDGANPYSSISKDIRKKYIKQYTEIINTPLLHELEEIENAKKQLELLQKVSK